MKMLLSWLKEFLTTEAEISKIEELLTLAGLEVEKVEPTTFSFSGVVVGEVVKVLPHPKAEKLSVAFVSDGTEEFQVVCGAPNCRAGMLTAFAKIGATLTDVETQKTWKIKKAKLREVESFGMLASEKELGLSTAHEGIMELPIETPVGVAIESLLGDVVFEVSLTPNLGHCMSIYGVARELSSLLPTSTLRSLPESSYEETGPAIEAKAQVTIEDPDACFEYNCIYLEGVKIGPSPKWLADRLEKSGIKSINNVVDATNYIMLEIGQPLHAFDYERIEKGQIIVRASKEGERLKTLDHVERKIPTGTLVIADANKPIAIAGVMGGEDSSVQEETKNILIESAHFNPKVVRKASKVLHLRSDSSARFERGIDHKLPLFALKRAAKLIQQVAGGDISQGFIEHKTREFPPKVLFCRLERIHKILGIKLSLNEVEEIFRSLQMEVKVDQNTFEVIAPSFRGDLQSEIDLIEEIARIYGYNNIPKASPKLRLGNQPHHPMYEFQKSVRSYMLSEGLQEFITCDLISLSESKIVKTAFPHLKPIPVLHPSSIDQSILRLSLLPSLLRSVKINSDQRIFDISAFEIGKVHFGNPFQEKDSLAILLAGKQHPYHFKGTPEVDFFDLKGILENLFKRLSIEVQFIPSENSLFHPGRQAEVEYQESRIGLFGEVHPEVTDVFDLDKRIYFAELDLDALLSLKQRFVKMRPLPQFPSSDRDWTVTLDKDTPIHSIIEKALNTPSSLLQSCEFLRLYESEELGPNKKNATYRFTYRSNKKTPTQEAIEKEHERIINSVYKK